MTMKKTLHIVFAGGGTGGHLFPGLAVAEKLSAHRPGVRITFVGTAKPLERRHVIAAGFDYVSLPSRPLPRRASEAIPFVLENVAGYFAAGRLLDELGVAGVVGLGGYASVPMGRAAARRRLPLVLLEQNVVLGKANRWLSRYASLLCTSFAETEPQVHSRCPVRCTGNPIRCFGELSEELPSPFGRGAGGEGGIQSRAATNGQVGPIRPHLDPLPSQRADHRRLIVLGGSGGARSLNENVPRALYKVRHLLTGWEILHQSGEADVESTRNLYRKFALEAQVEAFWPDLPVLLAGSSLAICRAGGTTLAELSAAAAPAVLLPYPHATDDHQRKNADVFVAAGAAHVVDEREIVGRLDDHLAELLGGVLADVDGRAIMARAMHRISRPQAAAHVATLIWSLVSSQARPARQKAAA
jgi:UDP-N-acetylglucosamine--N-acetylmuramyl-(pentapeptide) pyrophosphoryl-undecaprenol N-acetylglucosamine transferase